MEMCLRKVMSLDLGWRADVSLKYRVQSVQAIWREGERGQTLEEFDMIQSITVICQHFKENMHYKVDLVGSEETHYLEGCLPVTDLMRRGEQVIGLFDLVKEAVAIRALQMKQRQFNVPPINVIWLSMTTPNLYPSSHLLIAQNHRFPTTYLVILSRAESRTPWCRRRGWQSGILSLPVMVSRNH